MGHKEIKTIADIANIAKVSKSTVSRALNNNPLISQETRDRIQAIAKESNFFINIPARQLSIRQSNIIGFAMQAYHKDFSVGDLFTLEIIGAVSKSLHKSGYDMLMLYMDPSDPDWARQYLESGRVDGFIMMPCAHKQLMVRKLANMGIPFIVWGAPQPNYSYCTIIGDDFSGGRLATQYLIDQGRQKIAFLGGYPDEIEVHTRFEGYRSTLEKNGRLLDPSLVTYGDYTFASGSAGILKLLEQKPDMDAVFVNSDLMAISAIKSLRRKGIRVPDDVAVVGYDDLSIAATNDPAITTIRQHIPQIGDLLARNLIQHLQTGIISNITIPVELVIRESA